jgi:hypothetical protein
MTNHSPQDGSPARRDRRISRGALAGCGSLVVIAGLLLLFLVIGRPWPYRISDSPAILREVRLLKELVTIRYSIQKVAGLKEDKQPFGSESILLIVQAKALAGIDLGELNEGDIRVKDRKTVAIHLPPPRILHIYLDENQTKVWDRTKTWWTPWIPYDINLEQKARLMALDSVRQEALDMGILKDAQASAETLIRGLLGPLGFEIVEFPPRQS